MSLIQNDYKTVPVDDEEEEEEEDEEESIVCVCPVKGGMKISTIIELTIDSVTT